MPANPSPRRLEGARRPAGRRARTPTRPEPALAPVRGPEIELVYDPGSSCLEDLRMALRAALRELGLPPDWREWNRAVRGRRDPHRWFGPANVLVNGEAVAEASEAVTLWRTAAGAKRIAAKIREAASE